MNERQLLILRLAATHFLLPIVLTALAFCCFSDAFLINIIAQSVLLIIYLSGYWEFTGFGSRKIFTISLESLLLLQLVYRLVWGRGAEINIPLAAVLLLIELGLIYQIVKILIVINEKLLSPYEIHFPLHGGKFVITDGGNSKISRLMNYHYHSAVHKKKGTNNSMLYAADIVMLVDSYLSFMPVNNSGYPVFGETVFSPMGGTVIKVINDIPDNIPYSGNYPYNTGNTIVIRRNDLYCLIGHLKEGSISVPEGKEVKAGEAIARAGNSGWTERPHIHMQIIKSETDNYWTGTGVPLTFKGENLYKNKTVLN